MEGYYCSKEGTGGRPFYKNVGETMLDYSASRYSRPQSSGLRLENHKSQKCKCYKINSKEQKRRSMAQPVIFRPVTAALRVQSLSGPCGICGGEVYTGTDFLWLFQFFFCVMPPVLHIRMSSVEYDAL
jgi:hypothetical protein